jgi:hypothetical protein
MGPCRPTSIEPTTQKARSMKNETCASKAFSRMRHHPRARVRAGGSLTALVVWASWTRRPWNPVSEQLAEQSSFTPSPIHPFTHSSPTPTALRSTCSRKSSHDAPLQTRRDKCLLSPPQSSPSVGDNVRLTVASLRTRILRILLYHFIGSRLAESS